MKIQKNYRLSPRAIKALNELKEIYPSWTETDLIEAAIETMANLEKEILKVNAKTQS